MNSIQAKHISIIEYLQSIGCEPTKEHAKEVFYNSPFREERTASFAVNLNKNVWRDHGDGTGGTIIDLVMRINNVGVSGALQILSGTIFNKSFFSSPAETNKNAKINISKIKILENRGLIAYLKYRAIPSNIAKVHLQEIYYTIPSYEHKQYYALAFRNDKGGYEIRSKVGNTDYKFSTSPKYITSIPGKSISAVNIFEGFFDFLSALTHFNTSAFKYTTIILNSLVHLPIIFEDIKRFPEVNAFLDNDEAGKKALMDLMKIHPNIINRSLYYSGYKDFNEFLQTKFPLI